MAISRKHCIYYIYSSCFICGELTFVNHSMLKGFSSHKKRFVTKIFPLLFVLLFHMKSATCNFKIM